jgi:CubicO group peptidase (beta-lactamase class C family)
MSNVARLLLLCLLPTSLLAATHAEKIDALLAAYNQQRFFNGSALVAEDGQVILRKGYGMANMEWQIPNGPDTKFRLGSITKQFTSMVIMQLVGEGKIKLDDKITTYLTDYRKDTGDKVTVRHLLSHTSGIPSYTSIPRFLQDQSRDPYKVADFVKKYASGDLAFQPGSKFEYDNSGYFLLGAIIEKVTGMTYEKALQQRVFDPLGMKETGYDHAATVLPKRAAGYVLTPDGYENAAYLDMSIPFAAGSLYSTVDDLYKWDRALYNDKLLSAELKTTMFTPVLSNYAFGWSRMIMTLDPEGKTRVSTISHNGGINGFSTVEIRIPDRQDLIVLLDNTSRGDKLNEVAGGIAAILYDLEAPPPEPSLADELTSRLAGGNARDAIAGAKALKAKAPQKYFYNEAAINLLGYGLLWRGRVADAIEVFLFNVEQSPKSANVYDSLAEAYAAHGDRALAVANYKKSLELNPQNRNAAEALKKLEQK